MPEKKATDILFEGMVGKNNPIKYKHECVDGVDYVKYNDMCKIIYKFEILLREQIANEIKNGGRQI